MAKQQGGRRRRAKRNIPHGQAHIKASFNNTIITITDQDARSAGEMGIRKLDVIVRGSGSGRDTAIRTLQNMGIEVTGIKDVTPIPHNGCRPKKRKRG